MNIKNKGSSFLDYISSSLPLIEKEMAGNGPLDNDFSIEEVRQCLKCAKNGKASGPDKIRNEMLKAGDSDFQNTLRHIFNAILKSSIYPDSWKMSYLSPIFKAGDTEDPNNYRGVTVADCLSKLFCKLLDKRIYAYLVETGFWSHLQNGFKEGRRTDDNIFVLRTLFNKYVTARKSKIYLAFVDFTKFFDCINRDALYYKLIQCGITGNVYVRGR